MLELALVVVLGIAAQWIAWRIRVPAILPLILIGLFVGPICAEYILGYKFIEPIFDPTTGRGLVPQETLSYFVSLAIGIILFEGGLTLKLDEVRGLERAIINLCLIGSLVTLILAGIAAYFVEGLSFNLAFLFSSLIIVTGPTVIGPILRNVPLKKNVATVLKWEGIVIDPVGALVAVMVFKFIIAGIPKEAIDAVDHHAQAATFLLAGGGDGLGVQFRTFLTMIFVGLSTGALGGYFLAFLLKRKMIPHYLLNVFALALVIGIFTLSDEIVHESGLLSVVVMGMVLGNMNIPNIKEILDFKESLTVLLISVLFILLSANMDMSDRNLLTWNSLILFAIIIFIVRPVGVFLSTFQSDLSFNEKLFISWVGPRGIVAAGIASLFGLRLQTDYGLEEAAILTPLVFMVVLGTVVLNATSARFVASMLNVTEDSSNGVTIIGANAGARMLAKYLIKHGRDVTLIDNSAKMTEEAKEMQLNAIQANIFEEATISEKIEVSNSGYLFALTSSDEVNQYACDNYTKTIASKGAYRLVTHQEMQNQALEISPIALFSPNADTINFGEIVRDFGEINEITIKDQVQFNSLLEKIDSDNTRIPIFVKQKSDSQLSVIHAIRKDRLIQEGDILVYMGATIS